MSRGVETCRYVLPRLSAYVDGAVSLAQAQVIRSHLRICQRCSGELDEMRAAVKTLRELPMVGAARPSWWERRWEFLSGPASRRALTGFSRSLTRVAAVTALSLVVFGVGLYIGTENIRNLGRQRTSAAIPPPVVSPGPSSSKFIMPASLGGGTAASGPTWDDLLSRSIIPRGIDEELRRAYLDPFKQGAPALHRAPALYVPAYPGEPVEVSVSADGSRWDVLAVEQPLPGLNYVRILEPIPTGARHLRVRFRHRLGPLAEITYNLPPSR